MIEIKGSKGGSSSQSQTVTPDNLRSKDTLEVLLALCEGPIQGLEDGARSFFVGDTVLQNTNGDYNFKTFSLSMFPGDEDPDPVYFALGGTGNNTNVNVSLASQLPVTRQTVSGEIDFLEVRLSISRLLYSDPGGIFDTQLNFRIEYKPVSESNWKKFYGQDLEIVGKTTSTYIKEFRQRVSRIDEPYEIRVTKLNPENVTGEYSFAKDVSWDSFQEIVSGQPEFPNTALIKLLGEASDQFSSLPQFSGIYKGMIIKVPSNYDPVTKTYTGIWNGSFKTAWTDNPAWCLYDFVMNDRYGIKAYYQNINLDKYDVYEAAQWCDELVPDGKGGTHPRYTLNLYITEPRNGKELAKYIAGSFNATFFDDLNGKAYLRVDKDDSATHLFTPENVYEDGFEYSYIDMSTRYNDITVSFRNPDLDWIIDRRRVFDQALIDKNGRIPFDFVAVGCINEQEALRRAKYKLITANTEVCLVSFTTNRLGQFVNVFDVMLIADPDMGYSITGRIKQAAEDGYSVTLRDPIYLEAGVGYDIEFVLSDGSIQLVSLTDEHASGYVTELNFGTPIDTTRLPERTVFSLQNTTTIGVPRPFRVLSVEEVDGSPDHYKISGVNINRNKWYDSDNITDSDPIQYSVLPNPLNPPGATSVSFEEKYIKKLKQYQLLISPTFPRSTYKYYKNDHSFEVWSREKGSGRAFVKRELLYGDTLINHPSGVHEFKILGISYLGGKTSLDTAPVYIYNVTNPADPPADVDWVKINDKEVYWGYDSPPDDFAGFKVRYHNQEGKTSWDDAYKPHEGVLTQTSFYTTLIPPSAKVIMVKAVDDFGVESTNAAVIYRAAGDIKLLNVVEQIDFHPTFSGTKEGCTVVLGELKSDDAGDLMYSGNPTSNIYDGGDFYKSVYNEMIYYPTFSISTSGRLTIEMDADTNGHETKIRKMGDTKWTQIVTNTDITAGDYELKVTIYAGNTRGIIRSLSAIVDVEDKEEVVEDLTLSSAPERVPLTKSFSTIKTVSVIIQNDGVSTAISYRVRDKNPTLGPEIELLDPSGSITGGLVDVIVKGY